MNKNTPKQKNVVIIGSGIGGLATACLLAKKGYNVSVFEKNATLGGRCNTFSKDGFTYDMGPSWYLMPDVFEHFFSLLDEKVSDHLELIKLSPSYRIFFENRNEHVDLFSDITKDGHVFESFEKGSSKKLKEYLSASATQYDIAIQNLMYKNYDSFKDFFTWKMITQGRKLSIFKPMHKYVSSFFKSDELQKIMMYMLVFLGSSPYNTPALYNIMNHIDFNMGVFYPKGGMYEVVKTLVKIGKKYGVTYHTNNPVTHIIVDKGIAKSIQLKGGDTLPADLIISNADLHFTETKLLDRKYQTYPESYWEKKVLAPSTFLMYLGIKGKIPSLTHHNLFFANDWKKNFSQIFDTPALPDGPSIYVCCPSKTDTTVAPPKDENLFVLVPIAPGLTLTKKQKEDYSKKIFSILEKNMGIHDLEKRIIVKEYFTGEDFENRYNSYKGTALGLAHTLRQTAIFRPNNKSSKVKNLYYVGANTNPGIGVPICLISAELAYKRIENNKDARPLTSLT